MRVNGSLGFIVWLFVSCVFYLLPVIFLDKYIGGWAWVTGIAFWVLVFFTFKYLAIRRSKK